MIGNPERGRSATGELWFKGPNVMAGYLANEQATAQSIDADGFLHTGDLAKVDADGCVYIVDRLKELIKYKGYQVPPAELEALLLTHPGIADAAVVGVTDAESGEEVPKAFVAAQPDAELTDTEVMNFIAEHVAPYKKVRQVEYRRRPEVGVGQDPAQGPAGTGSVVVTSRVFIGTQMSTMPQGASALAALPT